MTDQKLFQLCKKYGENARFWRQKFLGLLPEVARRELWRRHGFGSIFEFAAKLAGVSEAQVRLVLNLGERFEDKPALEKLLVTGEVSINKLARVVSIATANNQEFLAGQTKLLPQKALETLVRDERRDRLLELVVEGESLRAQTFVEENTANLRQMLEEKMLKLSPEVLERLRVLRDKGIDLNELILGLLEKREKEIADEKNRLVVREQSPSRYVPVAVKKVLREEHGDRCSIRGCEKPVEVLHHTQRWAVSRRHDPHYLAPLCRGHHRIAHSIDVSVNLCSG